MTSKKIRDEQTAPEENNQDGSTAEFQETIEGDEDAKAMGDETPQGEADETKYLRLMADFQNYKRRSEKERREIHAFANEKIMTPLLDVLDNFERALGQDHSPDDPFGQGMTLICEQFKQVLLKSGLEEISAMDAEFDPRLHHAIMMDESGDGKSGHISQVLQKGYTINGKVIRPAVVKVVK